MSARPIGEIIAPIVARLSGDWIMEGRPQSNEWRHHLKWMVTVMNEDDPDLGFVASLLSHSISKGGLTDRQERYAAKVAGRVQAEYERDQLLARTTMKRRQKAA